MAGLTTRLRVCGIVGMVQLCLEVVDKGIDELRINFFYGIILSYVRGANEGAQVFLRGSISLKSTKGIIFAYKIGHPAIMFLKHLQDKFIIIRVLR